MKVLFDQNLPHKLRTMLIALCEHQILTTAYLGWSGLKNGELLQKAEENGMDLFVTGDTTLVYEQNLKRRRLAIIVLSTNNWPIIQNHLSAILSAINSARPESFQQVECGKFSR